MKISDAVKLEAELKRKLRGEVLFDEVTRYLYSTDASLYQIRPVGVVLPRDREEAIQAIRTALKYEVAILPRGGGTSLAGQAVGQALVVDCSKYLTRVLACNLEEQWVQVEPGIVRDNLNEQLKASGLHFTPDVATSNRATVGGMIANNSSGAHSIRYGKTVDQVLALEAVLSDGSAVEFAALSPAACAAKGRQPDLEGRIYREMKRIVHTHADEIRARFPRVMRRAGGYALDELLDQSEWNLAKLLCGSEGTLAFITAAKVRLAPLPKATALLLAHFHDLFDALRATAAILEYQPAAVELLDHLILSLAAQNLEQRKRAAAFVQGSPQAMLVIEFFGEHPDEILPKLDRLGGELQRQHRAYACTRALGSAEQNTVWSLRKAGLGLMLGMKGDFKPLPFIEDAAVPVAVLPDYIREVIDIVHRHGREVSLYAHASVGLLHVRPIINLKQAEDVRLMRSISQQVLARVMHYGGMMSGEHGDGLVRSFHNPVFFGPRLYQAFREVKAAFDPHNRFNPGKIVDAQDIAENLRIGPHYHTRPLYTHFHFQADGGFDRAVEMCTGVGACRKTLGGTMCPSYMATRDEEHSTRGRANALRAALTGAISPERFTTARLKQVFDLCLACKGCKAECPSNVDVAKLKYEFLAHYYDEHGTPLRVHLFARPEVLGRLGTLFPGLSNCLLQSRTLRRFLERVLGIDRRRVLPLYAAESFGRWFQRRKIPDDNYHRRPQVVLFNDTFLSYHEPDIGKAAVRVLEALGYRVVLANAGCCGRPLISNGMLRAARPRAEAVVDRLARFVEQGLTIVGCEPSCVSAVKEDYPDLVREPDKAQRVAGQFLLIEDFVLQHLRHNQVRTAFKPLQQDILYHGHCHHKALFGTETSKAALAQAAGCNVTEVDSGCCGMAGAFGYEKEHYALSLQIGGLRLFPAIRALPAQHRVVANGFSCRHQIEHATGRRAQHVIEILAEALA
ncbi:MAG: FAD-binding protein [candidate division KSB1 bacterium]|nr:FAD-binding protein [candidate division KSB1 bacterium]MDZ7275334.1 FAD-binding protein [candidate division KSB1 bacterium]MDZ7287501.1 FAD-binding protein [candidate division KSB1 bacterium]MDZ7299615.1 FAD-binding protein [candidate division KSB1 bacterium]MDZ7307408.1 FAD-binding protein [candidate division KSB1 bacterium]